MTLENQVVSLDLSKRLKDLGFKQESEFYYADNEDGELLLVFDNGSDDNHPIMAHLGDFKEEDSINVSAYTVAELGEMLPPEINGYVIDQIPPMIKGKKFYWIAYRIKDKYLAEFNADTEADARAKMLIYLKENNLI